jgi:hypothetical protein
VNSAQNPAIKKTVRQRQRPFVNTRFFEEIGWPELVQTIASIRDSLPIEE